MGVHTFHGPLSVEAARPKAVCHVPRDRVGANMRHHGIPSTPVEAESNHAAGGNILRPKDIPTVPESIKGANHWTPTLTTSVDLSVVITSQKNHPSHESLPIKHPSFGVLYNLSNHQAVGFPIIIAALLHSQPRKRTATKPDPGSERWPGRNGGAAVGDDEGSGYQRTRMDSWLDSG